MRLLNSNKKAAGTGKLVLKALTKAKQLFLPKKSRLLGFFLSHIRANLSIE